MQINKDWKIESEELNVIVYKRNHVAEKTVRGVVKPAHDNWMPKAWFSNAKNALKWLVDHKVNSSGMADLETVVKSVDEVKKMIKELKI